MSSSELDNYVLSKLDSLEKEIRCLKAEIASIKSQLKLVANMMKIVLIAVRTAIASSVVREKKIRAEC